jgi:hypothetical protein
VDCAALDPSAQSCKCYSGQNDSPLCEQTPGVSAPGTTQYWAGATPGLRQLEVLRGLGQSSVVGSLCVRNSSDPGRRDYGYGPAVDALLERL